MIKDAPRVILIDIETSPNLGYTWGKWEQNILRFRKEWELLSLAWKELGRRPVHCIARPDFRDRSERGIVKAAWKLLNEADVLIGHNIDGFDSPKLMAKFIEHGLAPPRPYKTIDTKKIAKSRFRFNSNSLNDLAFTLKLGRKKETGGIDLWFDCMEGKPAAWRKMKSYNRHDVVLLEQVYERMRAWYQSHPNFALYANRPGCPVCASVRVQRRGFNVMKLRRNARLHCQDCGNWFSRAA